MVADSGSSQPRSNPLSFLHNNADKVRPPRQRDGESFISAITSSTVRHLLHMVSANITNRVDVLNPASTTPSAYSALSPRNEVRLAFQASSGHS